LHAKTRIRRSGREAHKIKVRKGALNDGPFLFLVNPAHTATRDISLMHLYKLEDFLLYELLLCRDLPESLHSPCYIYISCVPNLWHIDTIADRTLQFNFTCHSPHFIANAYMFHQTKIIKSFGFEMIWCIFVRN